MIIPFNKYPGAGNDFPIADNRNGGKFISLISLAHDTRQPEPEMILCRKKDSTARL